MSQGSPPHMKIAGYFQQSIRPLSRHTPSSPILAPAHAQKLSPSINVELEGGKFLDSMGEAKRAVRALGLLHLQLREFRVDGAQTPLTGHLPPPPHRVGAPKAT